MLSAVSQLLLPETAGLGSAETPYDELSSCVRMQLGCEVLRRILPAPQGAKLGNDC